MTGMDIRPGMAPRGVGTVRRVHFHDPDAPAATVVVPCVFVAVREERGRLLLVRLSASGGWELPGGRVDVGESAVGAAVREAAEEAGVRVRITGVVGLFTDPAHIVQAVSDGEIRQQFVVCFHGWTDSGRPRPDGHETVDADWFDPADVEALPLESWSRRWIHHGLAGASEPYVE